ncbi:MAG TPA: hypothetical protein H9810_06540 [Candidatus Gemmiger excrementavium]|uniref:Foldase n=1 Tax=Candidatus Gemmiger excrementavium TaxID=2838608 RepID=A0A9D2JH17_9FIRM|nr:hypothetical protein [Candidatus Gemmiger excrementavium]
MHSIKTKLFALGMAVSMLLGLAGCALSTPADVGTIGDVKIPAGVYLLAQYNAYTTASGLADLATGETANDVKAVLKAECTGTIGDEEVTATGAEYVEKLTLRAIEYYAAVETKFAELGATLEDAATAEAADSAQSLWDSNSELYAANGIGKASIEAYLLNAQKASKIQDLLYGENGMTPVTEQDYADYITNQCYYIESVQIPLVDYTTYSMADDEQKAQIQVLADQCMQDLNVQATGETATSAIYTAASTYVPQALAIMGGTMEDATQAMYYAGSQLYTPDDLAAYGSDEYNNLTDSLDAVPMGIWTTIDLGTTLLVARRIDPLVSYTAGDLATMYDLLTSMKSTELQDQFYAEGAALEHALDAGAMKTYSASNIKKNV